MDQKTEALTEKMRLYKRLLPDTADPKTLAVLHDLMADLAAEIAAIEQPTKVQAKPDRN